MPFGWGGSLLQPRHAFDVSPVYYEFEGAPYLLQWYELAWGRVISPTPTGL
jgi:hypothetical protein